MRPDRGAVGVVEGVERAHPAVEGLLETALRLDRSQQSREWEKCHPPPGGPGEAYDWRRTGGGSLERIVRSPAMARLVIEARAVSRPLCRASLGSALRRATVFVERVPSEWLSRNSGNCRSKDSPSSSPRGRGAGWRTEGRLADRMQPLTPRGTVLPRPGASLRVSLKVAGVGLVKIDHVKPILGWEAQRDPPRRVSEETPSVVLDSERARGNYCCRTRSSASHEGS